MKSLINQSLNLRRKRDDGFITVYWDSSNLHLASTTWDRDNS